MPLLRSTPATRAASTSSVKLMVAMTSERCSGSTTYGVVYGVRSAQS